MKEILFGQVKLKWESLHQTLIRAERLKWKMGKWLGEI